MMHAVADLTSHVYMTTNKYRTVQYTGVTSDLATRCYKHKKKLFIGFTSKYNVDILIYFEEHPNIIAAIAREKQIKGYSRAKKEALIAAFNPDKKELFINGRVWLPSELEVESS